MMRKSKLSQVLDRFKMQCRPLTVADIARELDLSQVQLEGMLQYWVRKGKLRQAAPYTNCGSCGHGDGGCPFVLEMPRSYELVLESSPIPLDMLQVRCAHHSDT